MDKENKKSRWLIFFQSGHGNACTASRIGSLLIIGMMVSLPLSRCFSQGALSSSRELRNSSQLQKLSVSAVNKQEARNQNKSKEDPKERKANRDRLFRLIPQDITFCFMIQKLADQYAMNKKFDERFKKSPLGQTIEQWQKQSKSHFDDILKTLEINEKDLINDILGEELVMFYRESKNPGKVKGQFGLLLEARNADRLAKLVDKINEIEKQTNQVEEVVAQTYQSEKYYQRKLKKIENKEENKATHREDYYFLKGTFLFYSEDKSLMEEVLSLYQKAKQQPKESSYWSKQLNELELVDSFMTIWLNPRSFDPAMQEHQIRLQGLNKLMMDQLIRIWKDLDGIVLYIDEKEMEIDAGVVAYFRKGAPSNPFLSSEKLSKNSALWQVIPEDALLAFATRLDGLRWAESFQELLPGEYGKQIRAGILQSLRLFQPEQVEESVRGLGPNLGFWIFSPLNSAMETKSWIPQMIFALQIKGNAEGEKAQNQITFGLTALAAFLSISNNDISLERIKDDKTEICYLQSKGKLPKGFQPAFAKKGDYFLLTASPKTIQSFRVPQAPQESKSAKPEKSAIKGDTDLLLMRVSGKGWLKYLHNHGEELASFFAENQDQMKKQIVAQLKGLMENLELLDVIEIHQKIKKQQIHAYLRIKTNNDSPQK